MTDRFTIRCVVGGLVLTLIGAGIFMFILTFFGKPIPDQLDRLAVGALGAVAGILAKTGSSNSENDPMPVSVVNAPSDPVPVESNPEDEWAPPETSTLAALEPKPPKPKPRTKKEPK